MPTSYVYINTSGIHNVPLIAEGTSAVPRNYIDGSFNRIDASINQIINDISNNTDSFWSGDLLDISYNGNVGVGRKQPREKLDISGAIILSSSKSLVDASEGTIMYTDASGFLGRKKQEWVSLDSSGGGGGGHRSGGLFWSGDQKDISYNGNVGVGRKQPREQLDISGAIILSSSKSTSDASNGTIMFSDASGFLGRKNNIWVPLDNSGSGGGGGPSFDASFNYYFMDAPLAPTDGSSVLVTGASPYLHFSWQNPIQYRCAFNFVGSQPGPPDPSSNDVYNALPYFKGMRIEYRTFSATGSVTNWLEVPQNTVSGLWQGKHFLPREITNAYLTGIGGPFPYPSGSINSIHTDYSGAVIPTGDKIQIRVAMVNGAQVNITDLSYVEHGLPSSTDSSWNWLYIPTDGSGTPLGNYGPAPNPLTLTLPYESPDLLYYQFCLEGACDNPNSSNPIADTSFNTPFSILPSTTLRVQYGYDISGQRDPSSLQVGGNFGTISVSVLNPSGAGNNGITSISNTWSSVCQGANPSHQYRIPRYQMRNNVPAFINNWVDASGQADASLNQIFTTPNPSRSEATGTVLGGSSYQNFLQTGTINMSKNDISGTSEVSNAIQGIGSGAGTTFYNIHFLDRGDITSFKMDPNPFRCAANGDGYIGTDASANKIMYFKADISHTIFDVSSEIFKGWTQDPSSVAQTINGNHISFTTSDLSDAYILWPPSPDISYNAQGGFYLGIDISNVDVSNINLVDFPDISNNTPAYDPYTLHLYQMVRDASTYQPSGPKTHEFRIGEKPNFDISYNNYKTSVNLPSLPPPANFFGLINVPSAGLSSITSTDISLNSIYTTWAPTNDANLTNLEIIFSPKGINVQWDQDVVSWFYPLTATKSISNLGLHLPSSRFTTYPYSRIHNAHPQFAVRGIYDNNIFRTHRITSTLTGGRPFPITDISFAGLPLWWDQTYSFTLGSGLTGPNNPGNGEYPSNYTSSSIPYNSLYDNSNSILSNQLMWCNGGFTSGQYTTDPSSNPYIDYSGNYYTQIQDYSSFDTSGDLKNLSYTITNDDYWDGGNVTISGTYKWLMIKGQNSTSGNFAQVNITGTVNGSPLSPNLVLGTHYLLYVQEIDPYFSPANNTLPSGYTANRSGWKAVQRTWDQGATVQLNNANEAGCYRRRTSSGQTAVHHIKLYSPNNNVPVFFRIGLKNGGGTPDVKITGVTISYGIN